tara:strand:- start:2742 stop:3311 length:570 start_codon:yes stop_codon:yes gene_type:complete
MAETIIRSAGTANWGAKVREEGHLETFSVSVEEFENVSARDKLSFVWSSVPYNSDDADTQLLVQCNSDTLVLHIQDVTIQSDADTIVRIHLTDRAALTPTGTLVLGVCINQTAPKIAPALAYTDETNNTQGNIIWAHEAIADQLITVKMHGAVLLAKGQSIAIDLATGATALSGATITGFFAKPDESRI